MSNIAINLRLIAGEMKDTTSMQTFTSPDLYLELAYDSFPKKIRIK